MTELLPCPFCGGKAMKITSSDGFTSIGCLACNPIFGVMIQGRTEAEAIEAWNTRYYFGLTDEDYSILLDEMGIAKPERTCHMETVEGCQNWMSCSECCADYYDDQPLNYCPNCGAKVVME